MDQVPNPAGHQSADEIFADYLARVRRGDDVNLDGLCAEHPALASEFRVRHRQWQAFQPHADRVAQSLPSVPSDPGHYEHPDAIGPYRIQRVLGEGGMGTVYLAEQTAPVQRRVALKMIKPGMDSRAVMQRFDAERKALALMEHASIARFFDADTTTLGQSWFAMEYVDGKPITDFCDEHRLAIADRIQLFQQVCSGVEHAHRKGILHRDLKPSNVLVTLSDGKPAPKIIDFGLAKALDHQLAAVTVFTQQGQAIGTPEYMSPEQAGLGGVECDHRTDVYSLGVLLYELLTGDLPFRSDGLRRDQEAMRRIIREAEPPPPSTRSSALGARATAVARQRGVAVEALRRQLRGDLDWIALKALEKERHRRYATALDLAADLQRHLNNEPIRARPPQLGYKLRKFLRRHRSRILAGAIPLVPVAAIAMWFWLKWDPWTVTRIRFEGNASDESGHGNHGRAGGGYDVGHDGQGMTFSGNRLLLPNKGVTGHPNCTVEFWFRPREWRKWPPDEAGALSGILFDQSEAERPPGLRITVGPDVLSCQINQHEASIDVSRTFELETWHHVAVQWTEVDEARELRLFLDGKEVGKARGKGFQLAGGIALGAATNDGQPFIGTIDELRISSVARY